MWLEFGLDAQFGMRTKLTYFAWIAALVVGAAGMARGDVIDFQSLASAATPTWFDGTLDSPLTIALGTEIVMLTGGELLNHQFAGVDQTIVYATENLNNAPPPLNQPPVNYPGVYSDPLKVTFNTAVNGFSVQITNELNNTYKITDNLGHSTTQYIPLDTTQTLALADSGITWVTISSLPVTGNWEYAVDNLTFNGGSAGVPEPSNTLMLLISLGVLAAATAFRRKTA